MGGAADSGRSPSEPIAFEPYLRRARGTVVSPVAAIDQLITGESNRMLANWVVQVANLPAYRAAPEISLQALQSTIPQLLQETLLSVAGGDLARDPGHLAGALPYAERHGQQRRQASFSIDVVLAEYHLLHREVWTALWRLIDAGTIERATMRTLQPRLDAAFDQLAAAAADAWVRHEPSGAA